MPVHDSLREMFREVPFEGLVDALRDGRDLSAWNGAFAKVLERVSAAVRRRFPDEHLCDDAVDSACRTFLRRARAGQFTLEGPEALTGLLVLIAYRKATRAHRTEHRAANLPGSETLDDVPVVSPACDPEDPDGEVRRQTLRSAMAAHLEGMVEQVARSRRNALHARIFRVWFEAEAAGRRITDRELAATTGSSERTARRARAEFLVEWEPLVCEGREALRELESSLA